MACSASRSAAHPLIALALGIVTAAVMYYAVPESITQTNLLVALAIGAASGLTAVGTNQVVKQLAKTTDDTAEASDSSSDEDNANG